MAKEGNKKHDDQECNDPKRLTREEYDRLVQGVEDFYFGGKGEPTGGKASLEEKSAEEEPKDDDDKV